jgi:hypothetical protein
MPGIDSQNVVVLAVVATATVYLASRAVSQFWRSRKGCGAGCANCSASDSSTTGAARDGEGTVVSLEQLTASGKRIRSSK